MAGIIQRLRLQLDRASVEQTKRDAFAAATGVADAMVSELKKAKGDAAGRDIALKAVQGLKAQLIAKATELQELVNKGLLSAAGAKKQGEAAGKDYAQGLLGELKKAQAGGVLSTGAIGRIKGVLSSSFGIDLKSFDQAPQAAEKVGVLSKGLGFLRSQLTSLVAPLAAFFTARSLIAFGKDSIREFEEDSKALNDLRVNVERAGASFTALSPEIEKVGDAFIRTGRLSGDDFNKTLSQLIGISGDVENSLKNVGLVTDFAAKHNLSLQQATDLVGKAMVGNARALREFGIEAKKGDDAILLIRKDSQGFVDQQGPTLEKSLNALSFLWRDFKSAVGEALVEAGGGTSILDTLSGAIQGLTRWVKDNKGQLRSWVTDGLQAVQETIRSTTVDVLRLEQFGKLVSASFSDLDESTARLNARYLDLQAAFLDVAGFTAAAKASRDAAADLRRQADGVRDLAAARREEARALGDAARAAGRAPSTTAATTWHGGPSRVESVPSGGRATQPVHTVGGGAAGTDPEIARIRVLTDGLRFDDQRERSLAALATIESRLRAEVDKGNLSLDERIKRLDKIAAIEKALQQLTDQNVGSDFQRRGNAVPGSFGTPNLGDSNLNPQPVPDILQGQRPGGIPGAHGPPPGEPKKLFGQLVTDEMADLTSEISDRWDELFSHIGESGTTLQEILSGIFTGMAEGLAAEVSKIAKLEGKTALAHALRETAEGIAALFTNPAKAAGHFKAAAVFTAEAAAWAALGGAAGSLAGGGAGAGGGGGSDGGKGDDQKQDAQPKGKIIIHGGELDPNNQRQQDALEKARQTFKDGTDVAVEVAGRVLSQANIPPMMPYGSPVIGGLIGGTSYPGSGAGPDRSAEGNDPLKKGPGSLHVTLTGHGILDLDNRDHIDQLAHAMSIVSRHDVTVRR